MVAFIVIVVIFIGAYYVFALIKRKKINDQFKKQMKECESAYNSFLTMCTPTRLVTNEELQQYTDKYAPLNKTYSLLMITGLVDKDLINRSHVKQFMDTYRERERLVEENNRFYAIISNIRSNITSAEQEITQYTSENHYISFSEKGYLVQKYNTLYNTTKKGEELKLDCYYSDVHNLTMSFISAYELLSADENEGNVRKTGKRGK